MDGDQLVDFYWIDPVMVAERLAGKSKFAGKLFLQFEKEDSLTKRGVCAFGPINGGLVFQVESAYLLEKISVPLISVFYSYKSFLKGMTRHPINCKNILMICAYSTYFPYSVLLLFQKVYSK